MESTGDVVNGSVDEAIKERCSKNGTEISEEEVEKLNRGRNVVISIEEMLEQLHGVHAECCIYRVPNQLRKMNETAYDPQVISIGPFHHGRKDLKATEGYKLHGLANFLRRLNKKKSLDDLKKLAQTWVKEAQNCYAEPINMNDEEFVKMMLVDGCFVVELLILYHDMYTSGPAFPRIQGNLDLSFYNSVITGIYSDLTKLENQIPFFVLQRLFDLIPQDHNVLIPFIRLIDFFLSLGCLGDYELDGAFFSSEERPMHLVDFLSFYCVPKQHHEKKKKNFLSFFPFSLICRPHRRHRPQKQSADHEIITDRVIPPSITELCEAGVVLKKEEQSRCLMNISFENGVLEIPPLLIDDSFETIMRNVIAFEHFPVGISKKKQRYATEYVQFLDYLISTEKDVSLLVEAGIIVNEIGGSHKEVSKLFNNLFRCVFTMPSSYNLNHVSEGLWKHRNGCWNRAMASLKHNYFNTPWAFVSFCAASFLIALTLLQTIFTAITTFH